MFDFSVQTRLPRDYKAGLMLEYVSASSIKIKPGSCVDDANEEILNIDADLTVSLASSGAGGLDTGTEQSTAWYFVWLIGGPGKSEAGLFSLSMTAPTMPSGYTYKRLLCAVKNDLGDIIVFHDTGNTVYFIAELADLILLENGQATLYTTIDVSSLVPLCSTHVILFYQADHDAYLRPYGKTMSEYIMFQKHTSAEIFFPIFNGKVEYKTANAGGLSIYCVGFIL